MDLLKMTSNGKEKRVNVDLRDNRKQENLIFCDVSQTQRKL